MLCASHWLSDTHKASFALRTDKLYVKSSTSINGLTMDHSKKIRLEVMYKADYCLSCYYMDEAVREVLPKYADQVEYRRVDLMKGEGKKRFLELSVSLFGEDGVYKSLRLAPVPSLFIEGELFFDAIPPRYELEEAIAEAVLGVRIEIGRGDC